MLNLIDFSKEKENNESFCKMIDRVLHFTLDNIERFLHYCICDTDLYYDLDGLPIFLVDTEQSGQVVNNIRVPNPESQKFHEGVFISDSLGIYKRNYSFQNRYSQSPFLSRRALWGTTNAQIFIWVDKLWNIAKEKSTVERNNFCILFYWTLLHELSHAFMDSFRDDITKNIDEEFRFCKEESLANAVSINLTVQGLLSIRKSKRYLHNYIRNYQPFAYKLGMVYENTPLLEEAVKTWIMIKSGQTAIPAKNAIQDWLGIVKPFRSLQQYYQNLLLWYETNIFRQHQSQNKIDSVSGNEDIRYVFGYKGKMCSDVMLVHKVISEFLICHPLLTRKGLNDFFNLFLNTNEMYDSQEGAFCSTLFSPTKMNNRKGLLNRPLKCSDGKLYLQPSFFSVEDRDKNIRCFLNIIAKLYMGPVIAFDRELQDYIKSLQHYQECKSDDMKLEEIRRIERKIKQKIRRRINDKPFM